MGRQVFNQTRGTLLVEHLEMADNYLRRLIGLMGRPELSAGHGLWIIPCNDIHSFFMRFEFDAVFLDKTHRVLYTLERMKPWRISKIVRGGKIVLELPAGTIAQTGTQVGDQLELRENG
jgi:uncharacterized membrane protein (UPF0127 family)